MRAEEASTDASTHESERGRPVEFVIERGAVRLFARAVQSTSPEHQGEDAVIPPTFLMSVAQWMPDDSRVPVGFERARLLHGGQEFLFHGEPPRVGARLMAQERVLERYEKTGRKGGLMRFAVVATEFRDAAGRLVAETRSTLIEKEAPSA